MRKSELEVNALTLDEILDLLLNDGEPMATPWHRIQMNLLHHLLQRAMAERGRKDYYAGGNEFICFSMAQARALVTGPYRETWHLRGPDVFWVGGAEARAERQAWIVWEEQGRYPDLVIELLAPMTAHIDRTTKKEIYERTYRAADYFMYDLDSHQIEGFHLVEGAYRPVEPDARGRFRVASLGLWLGTWQGVRTNHERTWLRLFDDAGRMIPTPDEPRDTAEALADAAEAEVARLRASVEKSKRNGDDQGSPERALRLSQP